MESPGTVIKSHPNKFSAACFLLQFPGVRSDANSPAYALSACLNHCLPTIAAGSLPGKSIFLSLPSIRETFCCGKCQLCGSDTNCITNNKQTQFFLETGYYVKCVGLTPIAFTKRLDFRFLYSIERYLNENKKLYDSPIVKCVEERKNGRRFSFNEHLRAYIHAQLSSLRSWSHLEPHLPEIDEIFCNYDVEEIFHILDSVGHDYFIKRIIDIKCGNLKIDQQMQSLRVNIGVFKELIEKHGSLDGFVTSRPVLEIVSMLSQTGSPYNLRFIGMALASEYIRNVGVDCPKPDMHMRRIFGSMRLGQSLKKDSTAHEVYRIIAGISEKTGYTQARIDNILWSYCAKGYGAVCASEPKCNECVIQEYCSHGDNKH